VDPWVQTSPAAVLRAGSTPADAITNSDDQILDMWFGDDQSMQLNSGHTSPTDDGYLRMSTDEQSYVRFMVDQSSVQVFYTTTGFAGETFLGQRGAESTPWAPASTGRFKALGRTLIIYQGGGTDRGDCGQ